MHTADLLDHALRAAERLGYKIRQEWLGGSGGGDCEIQGQKWIFVDLALSPPDQLQLVVEVLRREPRATTLDLTPSLKRLIPEKKAA
ncbi:MAG TPA: hypothetical protein VN699_16900 [Pirellulales bacterium]|nr:hypothetical protein [Pirellulales bacterium]